MADRAAYNWDLGLYFLVGSVFTGASVILYKMANKYDRAAAHAIE